MKKRVKTPAKTRIVTPRRSSRSGRAVTITCDLFACMYVRVDRNSRMTGWIDWIGAMRLGTRGVALEQGVLICFERIALRRDLLHF
jgi:hypothetical protein